MTSGDWLPAQAPFDLVRRGYSPEQVTAHLERLEYDLRITTANRDATNQRLNELGGQLAAAQAEADSLRAQLDRSALEPVSMANLSDRMQRMIRLAEEEASEIRARSEADADRLRSQLESSLSDAVAARAAFDTEREHTRKQLAEQVQGLIAEATTEAQDTTTAAQDESARLRHEANAEAERTVTAARTHSEQTVADARASAAAELAAARAESERLVSEATAAADVLTAGSTADRERLDAASLAHRTQVEEDFEIAMTDRRREAHRVITDREEASTATAKTLITDAKAHSAELLAAASTEAQRRIQRATAYADDLVNRASAESHQRVADADAAVLALQSLRAELTDQFQSLARHLDHIRELAGSASVALTPPAAEQNRPLTAQFPVDPAGRPTPVDIPIPVLDEEATTDGASLVETATDAERPEAADLEPVAPAGFATADSSSADPQDEQSSDALRSTTQFDSSGAAAVGPGSDPSSATNQKGDAHPTSRLRIRGRR